MHQPLYELKLIVPFDKANLEFAATPDPPFLLAVAFDLVERQMSLSQWFSTYKTTNLCILRIRNDNGTID